MWWTSGLFGIAKARNTSLAFAARQHATRICIWSSPSKQNDSDTLTWCNDALDSRCTHQMFGRHEEWGVYLSTPLGQCNDHKHNPANTSEFLRGAKVLCLNLVTWILGEKAESIRSDCIHCQMVPSNVMSKLTISAARSAMCWYTTSYMTDRMRGSLLSCKRMILAVVFVTSVNFPHALLGNASQSWSSPQGFSWSGDTEWVK